MSTKKIILIFVLAVLLVLTVILCAASCSSGGQEQPEATAEPTAEPTEPAVTKPLETETSTKAEPIVMETAGPSAKEPPVTEPPANPVDTGTQTDGSGSQSGGSQSNAGGTSESNQDLQTSIPAETALPATQPPVIPTQVPTTEPVGCQHEWQSVYHPEEGHYEGYAICKCGYRCQGPDDWFPHRDSFPLEDALLYHTSYGVGEDYIVDVPAYTTWVCSKCGADSDTQP